MWFTHVNSDCMYHEKIIILYRHRVCAYLLSQIFIEKKNNSRIALNHEYINRLNDIPS